MHSKKGRHHLRPLPPQMMENIGSYSDTLAVILFRLLNITKRTQKQLANELSEAESAAEDAAAALSGAEPVPVESRLLRAHNWEMRLSRFTATEPKRQPSEDQILAIADALGCPPDARSWLLRAADIYPVDEEIANTLSSERAEAEQLGVPVLFIDYRWNIIGWTGDFAAAFGLSGPTGLDLKRPVLASSSLVQQTKPTKRADAPVQALHLLDTLYPRNGLFYSLDSLTKRRLMNLVKAYWTPQLQWRRSLVWMNPVVARVRNDPDARVLWDDYSVLRLEDYGAAAGGYGYHAIHMRVGEKVFALTQEPLRADPRLELARLVPVRPPKVSTHTPSVTATQTPTGHSSASLHSGAATALATP